MLALIVRGFSNKEIAANLALSAATVATHVRHILEKTGAGNRTEAATLAVRDGILASELGALRPVAFVSPAHPEARAAPPGNRLGQA